MPYAHRAHDYRVGAPMSRSYLLPHVQTGHTEGGDIAERCGEAAGFQAEGRLVHPVQAAGGDEVQDLPDSQAERRATNDHGTC